MNTNSIANTPPPYNDNDKEMVNIHISSSSKRETENDMIDSLSTNSLDIVIPSPRKGQKEVEKEDDMMDKMNMDAAADK